MKLPNMPAKLPADNKKNQKGLKNPNHLHSVSFVLNPLTVPTARLLESKHKHPITQTIQCHMRAIGAQKYRPHVPNCHMTRCIGWYDLRLSHRAGKHGQCSQPARPRKATPKESLGRYRPNSIVPRKPVRPNRPLQALRLGIALSVFQPLPPLELIVFDFFSTLPSFIGS